MLGEMSKSTASARHVQHELRRPLVELCGGVRREHAFRDERVPERRNRVDRVPEVRFLARPVRRRVARRVPAEPVALAVDQDRAFARGDLLLRAGDRVCDRERVRAVDRLCVHVLRIDAGADAGELLVAHRLADRLPAHAVEVVHEEEDHRQSAAVLLVEQRPELRHRGEVHRLPDRSAAARRVPDVGHDDAGLRLYALVERRTGGDRCRSADDRVVRIDPERREERVHAPAHAAVEARRTTEDLGDHCRTRRTARPSP